MGIITQPQLIVKIMQKFKDQYGSTWKSRLMYIFRRILFMMRSWFFDVEYRSVPRQWIEEFLEYWKKNILPNLHYEAEFFDCDDFARWFIFKLREYIHNKYSIWYNGNGETLGVVYHNGELLGGHAWVLVVDDTEEEIGRIDFVEPQIGEFLDDNLNSSDGWHYEIQAVIV